MINFMPWEFHLELCEKRKKDVGLGARLPGFESQLYHLEALSLWAH